MIIKLQRVMHRHGRWVFLFLLVVVIVAFILWDYAGWSNQMGQVMPDAMVYGQRVGRIEIEATKRLLLMHQEFMGRRSIQLSEREDAIMEERILRRAALVEKARRMGFQATVEELLEEIRGNPLFNHNGKFSEEAYERFVKEALPNRGLTEANYEAMLRDEILLRKLLMLVASTARVTPQQVQSLAGELAESISAAYCRFDASEFANSVRPTEDEVKRYFETHGDRFRIPEKRRVAYVTFPIEVSKATVSDQEVENAYGQNQEAFSQPDGKVKPFKEVAARLRADLAQRKARLEAGRRATDFTVKLVPDPTRPATSFDELVRTSGLPVKQTGLFAVNERVDGIATPAFAAAAFRLRDDAKVSDPVEDAAAIYVLNLLETKPSEPAAFEAVKSQVRAACVADAALKAAMDKGEEKRRALESLLKEGKPFDQAAATAGVRMQTIPNFRRIDPMPQDYFVGMVRQVASSLPVGTVSEFIDQPTGGFFVAVIDRKPAKAEEAVKEEPRARMVLMQTQQGYVMEAFEKEVVAEARLRLRRPIPPPSSERTEMPAGVE